MTLGFVKATYAMTVSANLFTERLASLFSTLRNLLNRLIYAT